MNKLAKKNITPWLLAIGLILFLVFSFIGTNLKQEVSDIENEKVKQIEIGGETLNVEIANTPESRTQGLSYRTELKPQDSMLFVFDMPSVHPFWMKDMNFSIDIIWISEDNKIVYIKENAAPESYPEVFGREIVSKYVLETVAGFSAENDLEVGDKVKFDF